MPKLIFYRQKRYDGAIRTGLELDDHPIDESYEEGSGERDPALLWFVDLRCQGPEIPDAIDDAEDWLLKQSGVIKEGFLRYSELLLVGADLDPDTMTWSDFHGVPEGVEMQIAWSAVRRVDARQMAANLADIGSRWDEILQSLFVPQEVPELG